MLKTFKSIMFVAAAAMAFTACNVEPVEAPEVTTGTHKVTFVASQVDTKTSMEINDGVASFDWEEADVDYFHIFENDYSNEAKEIIGEIDANGAMQLMASFENGGTAPFTYFGFYAPTFYTYPSVPSVPYVPSEQTDNGKYDPLADILIAKPVTAEASQSVEILSFQFKRIVAINVMTLKGLAAGETVKNVSIVSDKPIAGNYDYGNEKWDNSLDTQISVSANSVANDNGEAVIYFVSAPVENAQLTITATTAAGKTYSKELAKTISFTEGGVKTFGVTVEAAAPVSNGYIKVTSNRTDWSGEYLLVYEPEEGTPLCWTGVDAGQCHVDATITDGVIAEIPDGAVTLVIEQMTDGYSIKINSGDNAGKYVGRSSYSNGLDIKDEPQLNTLDISDGSAVIVGEGGATLRYNKSAGIANERFRYYKSGQEPVQLYRSTAPFVVKQPQTLSFPETSYEVNLGDSFTAPALSGAQTAVTYLSTDPDVATVDANTGAVTIVAAGETTITATAAADNNYLRGFASYTLTVIDPSAGALTTIAAIFEASATEGSYKVIFDNWVVSAVSGSNAYVTDGTNGFIVYKSGHGFEVNDVISGTVTSCALTKYKGAAEFTNLSSTTDGLTITKNGTVTVNEMLTIEDLSGVNTGALISLTGLSYDGSVLSDGSNVITPYDKLYSSMSFETGYKYNVTGIFIQFDTTKEIAPRSAADIVEAPVQKYGVTIANDIVNGSVTANKTEAPAGAIVTLTATPATGYQLDSWSVKDASEHAVTVTDNSFTMPASAVTVSASFIQSEGGQGGNTPIELTFNLSSNPGKWPDTNSTTLTKYTYTLSGTDYTFALKNVKCNSGYLMLTQPAVLGLPAISGKKLTKVVAKNSGGCSTSVNVGISSSASSASYITGGESQKWVTASSSYTYNLSGSLANTMYYLYVTTKNAQITELTLTYE